MSKAVASFEDWVHAHVDALTRFAVLVVGDRAGADDAVQEALSRAYPRWDRISRADDPLAYVRRMIVNSHITWWRRTRRHEVLAPTPSPSHTSGEAAAVDEDLWRACLALPPRQRAAIVLRFYEGLSHAEVADVLGIAESTARSQTHRALLTLRSTWKEPDHD